MPTKRRAYTSALQKKVNRKIKKRYPNARKKARMVGLAVFSILISATVIVSFSIYKFMTAPFSSASNADFTDTKRVFKDDFTNIILIELNDIDDKYSNVNKLTLVNFDRTNSRYFIYHIPVDVPVSYPLNYDPDTFSNMYKIGNADQERGIYLIKKTILRNFAVKIDGYIVIDSNGYKKIDEIIGEIDENDLSLVLRLKNTPKLPNLIMTFREVALTNLKASDIYDIFEFLKNTSNTSSYVTTLNKYHLLDETNWDNLWRENLGIYSLHKESVKVFIANGSKDPKIAGLASWGGRVVENLGADVLELDNSYADFNENTIVTDDYTLNTVKKLSETLEIKNIIHVNDLDKSARQNPQFLRTPVSVVITSW